MPPAQIPAGGTYVAAGPNTVSVINTATNTVTATIPVGINSFPSGVAVTPNGSKVYVALSGFLAEADLGLAKIRLWVSSVMGMIFFPLRLVASNAPRPLVAFRASSM